MLLAEFSENIVFMDFGNTRSKFWSGNQAEILSFDYKEDWITQIQKTLTDIKINVKKCYYSSVNFDNSEKAKIYFNNINWINILDLLENHSTIDFSEISGMGTDRKLGLIAASAKYNLPIITIDSGTAITINVVDESKKCLGGFILPGIQTQLQSLSDHGSGLPLVNINNQKENEYYLGRNTNDAILYGILHGTVGSLEYHLRKIIEKYNIKKNNIKIILTGGHSELLFNILNKNKFLVNCQIIRDNNLVFLGIKQMADIHQKRNKK